MKNIFYILLLVMLSNCGSMPKYKKEDLKSLINVKDIEGEYMNYDNDSLKLFHRSLNGKLNWRKKEKDTTMFSSVKIKILENERLKFDFIINNKILKTKVIKYRLRNNGFLKLRNNNFRISGIPIIFGEYEVQKFEIGLNKDNDLILHGVDDQGGGLLIALSSGFTREVHNVYKRI